MQESKSFSGKLYTAGTNFTRPPVATNLNSVLMKWKMNICLKWQFFVIVIVTCPGTGTELYHHGSWNVF